MHKRSDISSTRPTIGVTFSSLSRGPRLSRSARHVLAVVCAWTSASPAHAGFNDGRLDFPPPVRYRVDEKVISVTKNSARELDLSPETIQRAIKHVEAERRGFLSKSAALQAPIGRRPGLDGPWSQNAARGASGVAEIRVFTVDTRDRETCSAFAKKLEELNPARGFADRPQHLCENSNPANGNIAQIAVAYPTDIAEFNRELDTQFLTSTDRNLVNDTRNLALGMVGTMGVLWAMPGEVTGWDKQAIRANPDGIFAEYKRNIKAGPVWDKDDPFFNYFAHPMAGAAYYTLSRHNGKSPLESFGYSFAMSTFFWEYGFEAFAEIPSMQDLIITPVVGSLLGEAAYQYEQKIRNRGGTVLGSKTLGKIALIILNPAGAFSEAVNSALGSRIIKNAKADLVLKRYRPFRDSDALQSNFIGIQFSFQF